MATLPNRQSPYEVLLIFGSGKVVSNSLTVQICQSSSYCWRSDCQSARRLLKGGWSISFSSRSHLKIVYSALVCVCTPAGLALVTLDTFTSLTVLFYVPLVLTLDLPEIKVIRVGTKFAYPSYLSPGLTCFLSVLRI